jgi:hypothetical protein
LTRRAIAYTWSQGCLQLHSGLEDCGTIEIRRNRFIPQKCDRVNFLACLDVMELKT